MKKLLRLPLLIPLLFLSLPVSAATPQNGPGTGPSIDSTTGIIVRIVNYVGGQVSDAYDAAVLDAQLSLADSELHNGDFIGGTQNSSNPGWDAVFEDGCTSVGTLFLSEGDPNVLHVEAAGVAPDRFGALVFGVPGATIPFGGPGSNLCAVPFTVDHFVPAKTTLAGTFTADYSLTFPPGSVWEMSFQFWYRQPDELWHLSLTDSVIATFTTEDIPSP